MVKTSLYLYHLRRLMDFEMRLIWSNGWVLQQSHKMNQYCRDKTIALRRCPQLIVIPHHLRYFFITLNLYIIHAESHTNQYSGP